MVHRLSLSSRRNRHFQHPNKRVLKDYFVTMGRCLHGVESRGETRTVLRAGQQPPRSQRDQDGRAQPNQDSNRHSAEATFEAHGSKPQLP